ncbi:3-oxoacyl-[acyl-carrier-protein] synthase III C-terminal domain-containing protein [Streptomyces sp. NPDC018055]|uniref:3-oxoacyl-[acyl-carrier-protein] synthase III C-terminal domain-containing protein n=1 Tax=Streptomyces sp. NPDC018055 TaxID=3365038 RepID=UPI0037BE1DA4
MPAYIHRPATVFPQHQVTTDQIADDIRDHHPDHPKLAAILRIIENTGVRTRYFTRPLDAPTVAGTAGVGDRAAAAFGDALDLAAEAARRTLTHHHLTPGDVDAIITTHSTGWAVPNLDIHLVERLGLRADVRRIALTTMACAGGTQALIRAVDMVTARPQTTVLVVAAEVISAVYNHADDAVEHMIYKVLFGDSAAATIVTSTPRGPGLHVATPDDTYEHVLPNSLTRYNGRVDHAGFHFDSTKQALTAADDVLPDLLKWLGPDLVDFGVIHPGSQRIIDDTARALGLDAHDTRHSTDTLTEEGNLGGPSVLRILERTYTEPPAPGAHGLMVAYGPGFTTAAIRGTWHA